MRGRVIAKRLLFILGLPIVLVVVWWFVSAATQNVLWPSLGKILSVFPQTWFQGRLEDDVLPSLLRLLGGYFIALVIGVVLGVVIGMSRTVRGILEPVLEFLRAVPPPVLIPIIMLFAGIGEEMKLTVIALGCMWPVLLNTVEGVRGLDEVLKDTGRSYQLRPMTRLFRLVLPGASPQIAAGARQALAIGVILMVIAEMFASSEGIGFDIVQFQQSFAIPQMWTGIIILGILGIALSLIFQLIEYFWLAWYRGLRQSQREG